MRKKKPTPTRRPGQNLESGKGLALVAVVGFAAYLNSLDNEFVYDDRFLVERYAAVQQLDWGELARTT